MPENIEEEEVIVKEKKPLIRNLLLILLIGVPLIVAGYIGVRYYLFPSFGIGGEKNPSLKPTIGPMYELDPFVANLADTPGNRFIKVEITLEMTDKDLTEELERRKPQIKEAVLLVLSSKTAGDVLTPQGKGILREEIMARINSHLLTGSILGVYFVDFVVQ